MKVFLLFLASVAVSGRRFSSAGTCTYDDGTFKTFDGAFYEFRISGEGCGYTLFTNCERTYNPFDVSVTSHTHDEPIYGLILKANFKEYEILPLPGIDKPLFRVNTNLKIFDDTVTVRDDYGRLEYSLTWIEVYQTLLFQHHGTGISVSWEKASYIKVQVPEHLRSTLCGMCGNFDGESTNDFETPYRQPVEEVEEFARSWVIPGAYCEHLKKKREAEKLEHRLSKE